MRFEKFTVQKYKLDNTASKKKVSYSIKKLLKCVFKQHKSKKLAHMECARKTDSFEFLDTLEDKQSNYVQPQPEYASLESLANDTSTRTSEVMPYKQSANFEDIKKIVSFDFPEYLEDHQIEYVSLEGLANDISEIKSFYQSLDMEDFHCSNFNTLTSVPVHFIRPEDDAFFWTSASHIPVDNDLAEPMSCCTYNQLACRQDRWGQA